MMSRVMSRATRVALLAVLGALLAAACSSGSNASSPTTTTVPVTPAMAKSVRAFLVGPGKDLVAFERATAILTDGTWHSVKECKAMQAALRAKKSFDLPRLEKIAYKLDDPLLREFFHDDLYGKDLLLANCVLTTHPTGYQLTTPILHKRLVDRLAQNGVTI